MTILNVYGRLWPDPGFCYRHTEHDLSRALEVVDESLAYVNQEYPYA